MWRKPFPVAGALDDDLVAGVGQELDGRQSSDLSRNERGDKPIDWRQLPIGRTTNQTTFIIPGRPVGYRLVARPGRRFPGTPVRQRLTVLIR